MLQPLLQPLHLRQLVWLLGPVGAGQVGWRRQIRPAHWRRQVWPTDWWLGISCPDWNWMGQSFNRRRVTTILSFFGFLFDQSYFFFFFFLAAPSQDVFLLPHIPWIGQGVVYFLYITLWSYLGQPFFVLMTVVRYDHTPIYHCLSASESILE